MTATRKLLGTHWPHLVVVVFVLLSQAKVLFTDHTYFYRDVGRAALPVIEEARQGADGSTDLFPGWTHHLSHGRPLLANPGYAWFHPANLVYLVLPTEHAFDLFMVLLMILAGVSMTALARSLGCSPPSALVAGLAFLLGGYVVSATNLLPTLAGVASAPLTLLAALRLGDRGPSWRRCAALALALALQAVGGQPEPLLLTAALGFAWSLWRADGARRLHVLLCWIGSGAWALALAAPQVLPATVLAGRSLRSLGFTTEGLLYNSLHPGRLAWMAWPGLGGHPMHVLGNGFPGAELTDTGTPYFISLYLGFSCLVLGLFALVRGDRLGEAVRGRWLLVGASVLAVLLMLGSHLPGLPALVEAVPLLMPFRYPVKFFLVPALVVPILAGWGLETIRRLQPKIAWLPVLAVVAVLVDFISSHVFHVPSTSRRDDWSTPRIKTVMEEDAAETGLKNWDWRVHHHRDGSNWAPRVPFYMLEESDRHLLERRMLMPATAAQADLRHAFERTGDLLDFVDYFTLARALLTEEAPVVARALGDSGVRYVISPRDDLEEPSQGGLRRIHILGGTVGLANRTGYLHRVETFRPRVRLVGGWERGDVKAVVDRYRGLLPARQSIVLSDEEEDRDDLPGFTSHDLPCGNATIVSEEHDSLVVELVAERPCLLFVTDTHAPGWSATLDDEPVPLLRANHAFRAVVVPTPGPHVVKMSYRTPGLWQGATASLIGLLLVGFAAWRGRDEAAAEDSPSALADADPAAVADGHDDAVETGL
ncbi:MAG: hypothetical protein AAF533_01210 [Acidobacteriota bacterium]